MEMKYGKEYSKVERSSSNSSFICLQTVNIIEHAAL